MSSSVLPTAQTALSASPEPPAPPRRPDPGDIATLRAGLAGSLVLPGEPGWEAASAPWNVAVAERPNAVLVAANAGDVVAGVRLAVARGVKVAVTGPGRGASATLASTLRVRTDRLQRIEVDRAARTARVGAGVSWGALQAALDGTGLTGPVGSSPSVSVVGLLLQGGYSWFSRQVGAAAGSLRAAEVVAADGSIRWIDDGVDPEAMSALRGGGGGFAAVTEVLLDLIEAPNLAGGRLMLPIEAAPAVLAAYAAATRTAPPEITLWCSALRFPPLPELPEPLRGKAFVAVDAVSTAGLDALEFALDGVRAAGPVVHDTLDVRTASGIPAICEEPVAPTPTVQRGFTLADLPDDAVAAFTAAVTQPGPHLAIQLRHTGGGPVLRDGLGTAVADGYVVNALAVAPTPAAQEAARQANQRLAVALAPWRGGRPLPSFVDPVDGLAAAYDGEQRARLDAVARRWDPEGTFVRSLA